MKFKTLAIKKERGDIENFCGGWSSLSKKEFEIIVKAIESHRKLADVEFKERLKRLFE